MLHASRVRSHIATAMKISRAGITSSSDGLPSTVAITGASGLLGRALTEHLESRSVRVLKLVRRAGTSDDEVRWSPSDGFVDVDKLSGVQAVIHLAGSNIGAGPLGLPRWTASTKVEIMESRRLGTRTLSRALASMQDGQRPPLLVSASGVGFYGADNGTFWLDESAPRGTGFLAEVAEVWERETAAASEVGVRVVNARLGVVLARHGGALAKLLPAFQMCVGGRIGPGSQYMSWIALPDAVRAFEFLISSRPGAQALRGPVNVTAPQPTRNDELARQLGAALHRPAACPLPSPVVDLIFGEMGRETLLCSQRALPKKLEQAGFEFQHPDLQSALRAVLGVGQQ